MKPEQQRIAIATVCGWHGCVDAACPYRKAQHLHKGGIIGFPEPYSTSRYPDYVRDLNAMHEAEKTLNGKSVDVRSLYYDYLALAVPQWPKKLGETFEHEYAMVTATSEQRAEAFLRTMGLWKDDAPEKRER